MLSHSMFENMAKWFSIIVSCKHLFIYFRRIKICPNNFLQKSSLWTYFVQILIRHSWDALQLLIRQGYVFVIQTNPHSKVTSTPDPRGQTTVVYFSNLGPRRRSIFSRRYRFYNPYFKTQKAFKTLGISQFAIY